MDWFFGFSGNSISWFQDMIKVAVISAKKNTNLEANCLYDGEDCAFLGWLEANGVKVIRASVPFREELFSDRVLLANNGSGYNPLNATGHFLRVLVARYAKTNTVLYTDCDVMFLGDVAEPSVNCVGVVKEFDLKRMDVCDDGFNSGVMFFNRDHLLEIYDILVEHFRRNNFFDAKYKSYDQVLLNSFYKNFSVDYLDSIYNWRPFQGINHSARIIHFHGPKPHRVRAILQGDIIPGEEGLLRYVQANYDGYLYYLEKYNEYLSCV